MAADAANTHFRTLARALIAEWDIPRNREGLARPRAIHIARIAPSPTIVTLEIFLLSVEVDEIGQVRDARFARPPTQTNLGNEVLSKVKASLFRPAFKDGRFIQAHIDLDYTVHVK
jgi:hypothetical protein